MNPDIGTKMLGHSDRVTEVLLPLLAKHEVGSLVEWLPSVPGPFTYPLATDPTDWSDRPGGVTPRTWMTLSLTETLLAGVSSGYTSVASWSPSRSQYVTI